jgi:glycosyltransferase involved in cell wall biosynthesis
MRDANLSSLSATPRVSVCLPVYNGANYVADAIRSVLRQTWTDFELVVQDNCSTDTTPAVLDSFHDTRISVERNTTNIGVVGNINRVIERSCGEYVHVLCHDDVLAPTCLEDQVRFLDAHPSVAVVFTWFEAIDAAGKTKGPMFLERLLPEPEILSPREAAIFLYRKGCSVHISTAMIRRVSLTPFDARFTGCNDWAKWVEISARADIAILRKVLGSIRQHDANLTLSLKPFRAEETYRVLEMLEARLPAGFPVARIRRRFYAQTEFAYAVWLALHGRVGMARSIMKTIRRHDPLLPIVVAFLQARPSWIKRRLACRAANVRPAPAEVRAR